MRNDPKCKACALHKEAQHVCMLGDGPVPCEVMIIGEAPGREEDEAGTPFVGRSGRMLDQMLEAAELDREDIFICNAVSCRPPDNRTPRKTEINACKQWLEYQIKKVKPKYVLLLGNVPLQSVLNLKGIRKLRGQPVERDGVLYLPTYLPSYALHDARQAPRIQSDINLFADIVDFGGIPQEQDLNITIVDNWRKVDLMIDALRGVISCDLETTCLYPWDPDAAIVSCGFGTEDGEFLFPVNHPDSTWSHDDLVEIFERIDAVIHECTVCWQNGKFDCLWLLEHYGMEWSIDFDSLLAHYICDENAPHDLTYLSQMYYGAPDYEVPLEVKQGKVGSYVKDLAPYHAHDLYYTRRLYATLTKELNKDLQVKRVYEHILLPCANLFVKMEHRGFYIDVARMDEVEEKLLKDIAKAEKNLKKWGDINWGSPQQVAGLLYGELKIPIVQRTPKGKASTAESSLKRIDHPAVKDLLALRGAKQQHSFFIEGWRPYIENNRIHPSFKLHGTVTGRLSCEHPNFQQVPRDPLIRSLVTAPPGWVFVEADLSQIELRIAAELSRVRSLVAVFLEGKDAHWLTCLTELERGGGEHDLIVKTAKALCGKRMNYADAIDTLLDHGPDAAAAVDSKWKEYRKKAKAVNFGYLFGMWWKKFKIYAFDNYGVDLTDTEARESREAFFELYPLEDWHKKQRRYARMNGYVRSLAGRKRRLPRAQDVEDTPQRAEAWRQAINAPVQSFANELNLMVLLQMSDEFSTSKYRPVGTIHDAVGAWVKTEHVVEVCERWLEVMRHPALLDKFDIKLTIPVEGEVKIGPWSKGVSLKKWKELHHV